ncbi:MFS transporter [Scytonema hofmannii PCC 7110]|uniref:MFS transporter n=1 Tax=Scytonema hofmannii PCC 7110 TaxID=128403 RepID=A0A139X2X3_9CYAN|nr:MFS transporter [Scytonema hofmannii]KYC39048.1 MFS transporter [Scytonema hofmannii PCC 7110]
MESIPLETAASLAPKIPQIAISELAATPTPSSTAIKKDAIRASLKASTMDSVFAAVFAITTTGILLSHFLVELGASPIIFGLISSIPMVVNIIQPVGAYLSERATSRFRYSLLTHGIARLLWMFLVIGIIVYSLGRINSHQLVVMTLVIVLLTNLLGGLGSASWLSWMAMIVPRKLRGRYFGLRTSAASLTNLICVPLAGLVVSKWPGGTLQGYGIIVFLGIFAGVVSIGCQHFQVDMNPVMQNATVVPQTQAKNVIKPQLERVKIAPNETASQSIINNSNFLMFLFYFSFWMLAFNLSAPYFNLYMLSTLKLDVSLVTLYSSIQAGANLLMLILWGKLSDKVGNRIILISVGILVAIAPLLWLGVEVNFFDIWVWLPLIHILLGGTSAAVDLCNNNMQLSIAPVKQQSVYFAIAAAVGGASGALGTTIGGFIAESTFFGGIPGLFAVSALFRLVALVPLLFVQEQRGLSLAQIIQTLWIFRKKAVQTQ